MYIEEYSREAALVFALNGRLDGISAPDLEARVTRIPERGDVHVVLDCSELSYVSSAGLRAFLICARNCQQRDGRLSLASLRPECKSVLEVSGLLQFIGCHDTIEAAMAAPDHVAFGGSRGQLTADGETATEIGVREEGEIVVVSLNGRLDGVGALDLEARVAAIADRGAIRMMLDCSQMRYVSSAGLRALLVSAKKCRQGGGKLAIASLQPECRSIMQMSGFMSTIEHYETNEAALAALV